MYFSRRKQAGGPKSARRKPSKRKRSNAKTQPVLHQIDLLQHKLQDEFPPDQAQATLKQWVASLTFQPHLSLFKAAVNIASHLFLFKDISSQYNVPSVPPQSSSQHSVPSVLLQSSSQYTPYISYLHRESFRTVRFSDKLKLRRTTFAHSRLAHLLTRMLLKVLSLVSHTHRLLQTAVCLL